ncbi:hypothetical protein [Halomonas sp.]|uniref:hypothetical protein n=1 Tax=Halomonas sp. TaxID=1486246 RepID=UPI003F917230
MAVISSVDLIEAVLALCLMIAALVCPFDRHWRTRPPPAGDLWWPYAWLVQNALVGVRSAGQWCGDVKAASVGIALAIEKRMMARLTQLTAMESWMRHHTSGLMMALAIVLALLLIWEGSP